MCYSSGHQTGARLLQTVSPAPSSGAAVKAWKEHEAEIRRLTFKSQLCHLAQLWSFCEPRFSPLSLWVPHSANLTGLPQDSNKITNEKASVNRKAL